MSKKGLYPVITMILLVMNIVYYVVGGPEAAYESVGYPFVVGMSILVAAPFAAYVYFTLMEWKK